MSKVYNLHYVDDLAAYEKGQGIAHHKNFGSIELGTIISYNESDAAENENSPGVPFGVKVLTIPKDDTTTAKFTIKGGDHINTCPIFVHPESHTIIKKVDVASKTLIDNAQPVGVKPDHMKFENPEMWPSV